MSQDERLTMENKGAQWGGVATLTQHFAFNDWSMQRILTQLAKVSDEELRKEGQMTHGSAFQMLLHTLDTEWAWRIVAQDGVKTPLLWEVEELPDLDSIKSFWQTEHETMLAYLKGLSDADLDRDVDYGSILSDSPKIAKVAHLLGHILYHTSNHRSELAAYVTQCGHSPGDMDFLDFINASSV